MREVVIAANMMEFKQYKDFVCKKGGDSRTLIYASSEPKLRGLKHVKVTRVGTWYRRHDIEAIEHCCEIINSGTWNYSR